MGCTATQANLPPNFITFGSRVRSAPLPCGLGTPVFRTKGYKVWWRRPPRAAHLPSGGPVFSPKVIGFGMKSGLGEAHRPSGGPFFWPKVKGFGGRDGPAQPSSALGSPVLRAKGCGFLGRRRCQRSLLPPLGGSEVPAWLQAGALLQSVEEHLEEW